MADTPLGIGLAALGITDALVPAGYDGPEANAREVSGVVDRADTSELAVPSATTGAAVGTVHSDQDAAVPAPTGEEVSSMTNASALRAMPDADDLTAPEDADAIEGQAGPETSDAAPDQISAQPQHAAEPPAARAGKRELSSQPGGPMALGLSRRRSSMMTLAPPAGDHADVRYCHGCV